MSLCFFSILFCLCCVLTPGFLVAAPIDHNHLYDVWSQQDQPTSSVLDLSFFLRRTKRIFSLLDSRLSRNSVNPGNSAPISIGSSSDTSFISLTNHTLDFSSTFSLEVFSNTTGVSFRANVAALTAAVGRSSRLSNGVEGICAGQLIPAVNNVYIGYPNIALVNCDDTIEATNKIITYAVQSSDCVLMYSLTSSACNFTSGYRQYASQMGFVLTTMSTLIAESIVQSLNVTNDVNAAIFTTVSSTSNSTSSNSQSTKSLMAIVYSIVGFFALLFLFIIVSGAVRVHLHPERYGLLPAGTIGDDPNNNQQFQQAYTQRAKGLARAVLDSIPLVTVRINHKPSEENTAGNDNQNKDDSFDNSDDNGKGKGKVIVNQYENSTEKSKGVVVDETKVTLRPEKNHNINIQDSQFNSKTDDDKSDSYELSIFYSINTDRPSVEITTMDRSDCRRSQAQLTANRHQVSTTVIDSKHDNNPSSDPSVNDNTGGHNIINNNLDNIENTAENHDATPHYTYTTLTQPLSDNEKDPTYSPNFLASLQQLQIDDDDDNMTCPICFENFKDDQILRILPCKHRFHARCVDPWLLNSSSHCPLCRVDLSLRQHEVVPEQPPGVDNNSNSTDTNDNSNPPIIIPEGYDLDTSYFNRFLDIWNAYLLPKEARCAALARFHEETELRRLIRAQRRQQNNNDNINENINDNENNASNRNETHSENNHNDQQLANRPPGRLGIFQLGHLSRSGQSSRSNPSSDFDHGSPMNNNNNSPSAEDDELQNHRRWKKFVASRRRIHELRLGHLHLPRSASTSASSAPVLTAGDGRRPEPIRDEINNTFMSNGNNSNSTSNEVNNNGINNAQSDYQVACSYLRKNLNEVDTSVSIGNGISCQNQRKSPVQPNLSSSTASLDNMDKQRYVDPIESNPPSVTQSSKSILQQVPDTVIEISETVPLQMPQSLNTSLSNYEYSLSHAKSDESSNRQPHNNTTENSLDRFYRQPATSLPIPPIPPLPQTRFQEKYNSKNRLKKV